MTELETLPFRSGKGQLARDNTLGDFPVITQCIDSVLPSHSIDEISRIIKLALESWHVVAFWSTMEEGLSIARIVEEDEWPFEESSGDSS